MSIEKAVLMGGFSFSFLIAPHPVPVLSWRHAHPLLEILGKIIGVGVPELKRNGFYFCTCVVKQLGGFQYFQVRKITEWRIARFVSEKCGKIG